MKKINYEIRYIKSKVKRIISMEKKKIRKMGYVIITVVIISCGVLIFYKTKTPMINNEPANVIEYKSDKNNKSKIFLEKVDKLETDLYQISNYVFSEKNMRIDETVGESSKDYVTVRGNFKVKYSVDMKQKYTKYDFTNEKITIDIPKRAIKIDSIELIGDIVEIDRYDSFFEKIKDMFNNNEEEMKDLAVKQLFDNARISANNQDKEELYDLAKNALNKEFKDYGLDIKINIVDDKIIGIKNK